MNKTINPSTVATPHILFEMINNVKPLHDVLSEMIDNSFGPDAGDASIVIITIGKGFIKIADNGKGIDDLNKLAAPGNTGSYGSKADIGQYGQGSKLWLGRAIKLEAATTRDGKYHHHIFDSAPIRRALKKGANTKWLNAYTGKGSSSRSPSGTVLTMRELVKGPPILFPSLLEELGRRFWATHFYGKAIYTCDRREDDTADAVPLDDFRPATLSKVIEFSGNVNGKAYRAKVGVLDAVGKNGGLFIAFGFRTIEVSTTLSNGALPARIHGQILLAREWKTALSRHKTRIVHDREELLADIEANISQLVKQLNEEKQNIRMREFNQLLNLVGNTPGPEAVIEKSDIKHEKPDPDPKPTPDPKPDPDPKPTPDPKPPKPKHAHGFGLVYESLGPGKMEQVSATETELVFTLNSDFPAIAALRAQPLWPALMLHLGAVHAAYLPTLGTDGAKKLFGAMLGTNKNSETLEELTLAIRIWWASKSQQLADISTVQSRASNLRRAHKARKGKRIAEKGNGQIEQTESK